MENLEKRSYVIGGELPAEQWRNIVTSLGQLGLSARPLAESAQTESTRDFGSSLSQSEIERASQISVSKEEFFELAETFTIRSKGGQLWSTLTKLHTLKVNAESYSKYPWYNASDYEHVPVLFDTEPEGGRFSSPELARYQRGLNGLKFDGLANLIAMVDTAVKEHGTRGYSKILGKGSGPSQLLLMKSIVYKKLSE